MTRHIIPLLAFLVLMPGPLTAAGPRSKAKAKTGKPTVADRLHQLARVGHHWKAFKLADKELRRMDRAAVTSPKHTALLEHTAGLAMAVGERARAQELFARVLVLKERALGANNPRLMHWLSQGASAANYNADHPVAERLYDRYLRLAEKLGRAGTKMVDGLTMVGTYYQYRYDTARAETLFMRALRLTEKHRPKDAGAMGTVLRQVAQLHAFIGDPKAAVPWYRRLIATYLSVPSEVNRAALPLRKLGELLEDLGRGTEAAAVHTRAEAAHRSAVAGAKPQTQDRMIWTTQLGDFLTARGRLKEAIAEFKRAQLIGRALYGKDSFLASGVFFGLARAYERQGLHVEALAQHRKVAQLADTFPGLGPNILAMMRTSVAYAEHRAGRLKVAAALYQAIKKAQDSLYGQRYARSMHVTEYLGQIRWLQGAPRKALALLTQAFEAGEHHLALTISSGTEKDKRAYLSKLGHQLDLAVSFATAHRGKSSAALEHALRVVFARKGRLIDALASQRGKVGAGLKPDARKLVDALNRTRAQLSAVVNRGPGTMERKAFRKRVEALEIEAQRLERLLAAKSATYRATAAPVTPDAIRKALPKGTALVEFVAYRPMDPKQVTATPTAPRRLMAYVLRRGDDGKMLPDQAVELGPTAAIDKVVEPLLEALADPNIRYKPKGRALDRMVMAKVRPLLGPATQVFLAPDGSLGLVPFAALVDEHGKFLVQRYTFTYLTSARDLLRPKTGAGRTTGGMVVADPIFDKNEPAKTGNPAKQGRRGRRSRGLGKLGWKRLPGTAAEAKALAALLPGATVVTGEAATESALKKVSHPRILHIATHGYFMPDQVAGRQAGTENPLLRAGLVMTGGNHLRSGDEDGILTALELAGLDLWGTRLVVLSACETGVGKVRMGEGVYGLRRALVLAGAQSQVVSLWQVDDDATKELMVGFYTRLLKGEGRSAALRDTQLGLLGKTATRHPFFWGSFVAWGEPGPL